MASVTIYNNPACGTSRNALAMILASGEDLVILDYLNASSTSFPIPISATSSRKAAKSCRLADGA